MYEIAKKARAANRAKAAKLADRPMERVDSADWTPAPLLKADVKTGMRPVSRRAYKSGGKVSGMAGPVRADRKKRKAGGATEQPLVDRYVNRDMKKANDYRDGEKHIGGMKKGGRAKKAKGGIPLPPRRPADLMGDDLSDYQKNMIASGQNPMEDERPSTAIIKKQNKIPLPPRRPADMMKKGGRAKKASGGSEMSRYGEALSAADKAYNKALNTAKEWADFSPSGIGKKSNVDLSFDAADAYLKKRAANQAKEQAGYKKGGRAKKMDGGAMTDPRLGMVKNKALEFTQNLPTPGLKKGGKVKHSDVAEDKALIKQMVKGKALKNAKCGGGRAERNAGGRIGKLGGGALGGGALGGGKLGGGTGVLGNVGAKPNMNAVTANTGFGGVNMQSPGYGIAPNMGGNRQMPALGIPTGFGGGPVNPMGPGMNVTSAGPGGGGMLPAGSGGMPFVDPYAALADGDGRGMPAQGVAYGNGMTPIDPLGPYYPDGTPRNPGGGPGALSNPNWGGHDTQFVERDAVGNIINAGGNTGGVGQKTPINQTRVNPIELALLHAANSGLGPNTGGYTGGTGLFGGGKGPFGGPKGGRQIDYMPGRGPNTGGYTGNRGMGGGGNPIQQAMQQMGQQIDLNRAGTPIKRVVTPQDYFNKGGRVGKATGGALENGYRKGGSAKKRAGTQVNIIIGKGQDQQNPAQMMQGQQMPPMAPPAMPPMGGQPPMPPMGGAGGPPMGGQAPMPFKSGGRVTKVARSYKDMEAGAGSGEGRLQKTDIAKRNPKPSLDTGFNPYQGRGYPNKVLGASGGRTARKAGGKV